MPNPTLYDNFSQVKQYIDQNQVDLSSYVTESELSNASYATTTYVADYVSTYASQGGVIDEDIIPKENKTYTLGTSAYIYNTIYDFYTYTYHLRGINNGTTLCLDGYANGDYSPTISINGSTIIPGTQNKQVNLGSNLQQFRTTYSYNYYVGDEGEIHNIFPTYAYVVDYVSQHGGGSTGSEVTYTYLSTYYPSKTLVNAMFSYDTLTGTLTITTLS